jgi:hypothetical protein
VVFFALSGLAGFSIAHPGFTPGATFFRRSAAMRWQVQPSDCNEFIKVGDGRSRQSWLLWLILEDFHRASAGFVPCVWLNVNLSP